MGAVGVKDPRDGKKLRSTMVTRAIMKSKAHKGDYFLFDQARKRQGVDPYKKNEAPPAAESAKPPAAAATQDEGSRRSSFASSLMEEDRKNKAKNLGQRDANKRFLKGV